MQKKTHIKKGDMVKVLAGEDRSKEGRVLDVNRDRRVAIVEGLNINKKHSKPTTANPQGGIVEKEGPIHISNLMLIDAKTGLPGRVGRVVNKDGKLERIIKTKKKTTAKS
ncbi:MAG: 50S ribosomal protein L24 [Flavobacteriales bacterium]|nr:50S ribosomal protein L24 [Flavobacteriales bacterium]MBK6946520.1 50S ribosomal protein L24 [Flavobacteriales bacterium]MBK7239740.1 50S ribosomal protein L24 [Flavobacteriales bacterium]MBK9536571.1 50S ribosomal protein L24 [Flavobacteriales bacterium]MBP9139357.1 50S ribosomal protein L24 [Flavobacteriales bacterium]